jgi:hypothetical protein
MLAFRIHASNTREFSLFSDETPEHPLHDYVSGIERWYLAGRRRRRGHRRQGIQAEVIE